MLPPLAEPISENDSGFSALLKRHKISTDEYTRLKHAIGRTPTLTELGVFSAMWSEHCSYKSSRVHLKKFPTTGKDVVVGPGENAGVVRLSDKLCVAFKMESHNHPSYIEPFHGAATGVGGILRDVFCMGARPVANLNCLRFGEHAHERTSYVTKYAVKGIGSYGNCVGIPTVGGNISFDKSYNGNCLVNAMSVGVIHEDRIFKGYASGKGNLVVYVGSATGRDGIHGATMASDSFSARAAKSESKSTIQVGDPFMEKLLLEATLEVLDKNLVVGLQDMGAAGLTSSSCEMAGRAGNGLFMDLSKVPTRTSSMSAYELMLSESQERMLMVIEPKNWQPLEQVLKKWQLAYAVIGHVTDSGRLQVVHQGKLEVDMSVEPVTDDAPKYDRPQKARVKPLADDEASLQQDIAKKFASNPGALLQELLHDQGTKQPIVHQYDHHIGTSTVRGPTDGGAALLWMQSEWASPTEPYLGLGIATSCNERYVGHTPRQGAAHAVLKCARMLACVGARPIAITDCLNFGSPEDPEVMWEFAQSVEGISDACRALGVAVVSGNVSLYNQTDGMNILPTPMIGMVGKSRNVRLAPRAVVKAGDGVVSGEVFFVHAKNAVPSFGASGAAKTAAMKLERGVLPALDFASEAQAMDMVTAAVDLGLLSHARDVGHGGYAASLAKMFIDAPNVTVKSNVHADFFAQAFGEWSAAYLLIAKDRDKFLAHTAKWPDLTVTPSANFALAGDGMFDFGAFRVRQTDLRRAYDSMHVAAF